MEYTISEVADKMGVTAYTLRYYDKEGLLPDVKRKNGARIFVDEDLKWLKIINCLKNTNMPIKKIKEYFELVRQGDKTIKQRYEMILEQKESVLEQIEQLQSYLQEIEFKEWYYLNALKDGTEENVAKYSIDSFELDKIPKKNKGRIEKL